MLERLEGVWCQWVTPVILATQEAEIRMIMVQGQSRQKAKPPSQNYPTQKRPSGVAQVGIPA
jgi:hypothetical protein